MSEAKDTLLRQFALLRLSPSRTSASRAPYVAGKLREEGFLSNDVQGFFYIAAKVLAVLVGVVLCVHLIVIIAKRWL